MCMGCTLGLQAVAHAGLSRGSFLPATGLAGATLGAIARSRSEEAARAQQASPSADIIFVDGTILTMDQSQPRAEAVALRGETIVAVGKRNDVFAHSGPNTRLVSLEGHALLPGFIDPHVHTSSTFFDNWLNIGPLENASADSIVQELHAAVARARPGDWIRGKQLDS